MSIRAVAWVLDRSPAEGTDLLVMIALADFADESGLSWPSVRRLAHRARVSERTARRALRNLEAIGQVTTDGGGGRASNRYRLTFADPLPLPGSTPVNLAGVPGQADPRSDSPPRTQLRPGTPDTAVSAEPSMNHQLPPLPPASGGRRKCRRHQRPRAGCEDCQIVLPALQPWCGECDPAGEDSPSGRMVTLPTDAAGKETVAPCPRCHPSAPVVTELDVVL